MPVWDRFILALYLGLSQHRPVGRPAAPRVRDRAIARGRLSLASVNDTSLLLLLALLPEASPHRPARAALRGPPQGPARLIQPLHSAAPPRLTDLVELGRPRLAFGGELTRLAAKPFGA
jgi:hypothetical protein